VTGYTLPPSLPAGDQLALIPLNPSLSADWSNSAPVWLQPSPATGVVTPLHHQVAAESFFTFDLILSGAKTLTET